MRSETVLTKFARGAVASAVVGGLIPAAQSQLIVADYSVMESSFNLVEHSCPDEGTVESAKGGEIVLTIDQVPEKWTNAMEQEFRTLALAEATRTITPEQATRLQKLDIWRERLINPRPIEEILLQLKRDRLLEKITVNLREYVQFQESASRSRGTSK
jgi:hypothetical protein